VFVVMRFYSLILLLPAVLSAADATLVADAFVRSTSGQANFGSSSDLQVSSTTRSLLRFALPPIPAEATLHQARLTLFVNRLQRAGALDVARVGSQWAELEVINANFPALGENVA
jgi:hypothetical protein